MNCIEITKRYLEYCCYIDEYIFMFQVSSDYINQLIGCTIFSEMDAPCIICFPPTGNYRALPNVSSIVFDSLAMRNHTIKKKSI